MSSTKTFKLVATGISAGSYDLIDRETGRRIGEVVKNVQHYNIAPRGCTVTYWTASFATLSVRENGQPVLQKIRYTTLTGREETTKFNSRAEAIAAIEKALDELAESVIVEEIIDLGEPAPLAPAVVTYDVVPGDRPAGNRPAGIRFALANATKFQMDELARVLHRAVKHDDDETDLLLSGLWMQLKAESDRRRETPCATDVVYVAVKGAKAELTPAETRQFAADLLAAADRADGYGEGAAEVR